MKAKRLISLMMAIMLVVTALSGLAVTASAAEDDVYVLNYNGKYDGPKWQYFSPYYPQYTVGGVSKNTTSLVFTMYDTVNKETFPVYCTDLEVGLDTNTNFRRMNLEDSTYAGGTAGVLRSIVLKGFPNTSAAALGAAAGVEKLTVGEAVAATQAAIWQTAHGDRVNFTDFCSYIDTKWSESDTANYAACMEEIDNNYASAQNEADIEKRIEQVYNYLIKLAPTDPTGVVASEASFVKWNSKVTDNGNGTATVTATATVDVVVGEKDSLTLTAKVGGTGASIALDNGKKEYTLTIQDVPIEDAYDTVTLAISGTQAASDVYLFDAVGARGESQSLIGITDNALPVYAEVNANDRVLIINKTDGEGNGLQNITFEVYYVCSVEDYVSGEVKIGTGVTTVDGKDYFSAPTADDIAKYVTGLPTAIITTDENGQASFNFGVDNDGIYIVVERENAVTTGAVAPFFVAIPGGDMVSDTDEYTVTVKPKNTVIKEELEIEKDVTKIDNEHDTYDIGEEHTWIIQSSIPKGLATGQKYQISDELDSCLTLVSIDRVAVAKDNGSFGDSEDDSYVKDSEEMPAFSENEVVLIKDTDYTVTLKNGNAGFVVALTPAGMQKVANTAGEAYGDYEVRVYFTTYINATAKVNVEIPNDATVDYTNNVGKDYTAKSDQPDVITGAAQILKVDASDNEKVLPGATFKVYRAAAEGETADATITVDGAEIAVVEVEFYDTSEITAETAKVTELVSDEDGKGVIYGLAYGTYYLVETKAPTGYNKLSAPVKMVIDKDSMAEEAVITICNVAGFELPSTGGEGTTMFMIAGVVIIAAAMLLIFVPKKKNA